MKILLLSDRERLRISGSIFLKGSVSPENGDKICFTVLLLEASAARFVLVSVHSRTFSHFIKSASGF